MSLNNLPQVAETSILIEEAFFQLRKERLKILNEKDYNYYILESSPYSVMVIATTADNEYVLNWEYRHPTKKILLSCPGGIMHADESPIACAERELLEETGFKAENFKIMGEAYPFPGICSQRTFFVRAFNATPYASKQLEHAEFIETELFKPEKLEKTLRNQVAVDGLLLTALFFAKNNF